MKTIGDLINLLTNAEDNTIKIGNKLSLSMIDNGDIELRYKDDLIFWADEFALSDRSETLDTLNVVFANEIIVDLFRDKPSVPAHPTEIEGIESNKRAVEFELLGELKGVKETYQNILKDKDIVISKRYGDNT